AIGTDDLQLALREQTAGKQEKEKKE
ncbi:MAG: hypothetical protein RLZZ185_945, partial [Bacteroidota bacterium]